MKIFKSKYELSPKGKLNSKIGQKNINGYLLRFMFDHGVGYSSVQTWPEFGDPTLSEIEKSLMELESEHSKSDSQIVNNIKNWAVRDALAREAKVSLVATTISQLENHYLVNDISTLTPGLVEIIKLSGFNTLKFKFGKNLKEETKLLFSIPELTEFKWRFDFNASLSSDEFSNWLKEYPQVLKQAELFEDPIAFNVSEWSALREKFKIKLALDFHVEENLESKGASDAIDVVVIKPQTDHVENLIRWVIENKKHAFFTSYMDHPVGQTHAAVEAAKWTGVLKNRLLMNGLFTNQVYEPFTYSEEVRIDKTCMVLPPSQGIGFTDLLEKENWIQIK